MVNASLRKVDALLFDKDGTLFEFHATWSAWAVDLIEFLSEGRGALRRALADEMDFDLSAARFRDTSPIIAGTNREAAECVHRALPHRDLDALEAVLIEKASTAPLAPAVPLGPLLDSLLADGLVLGVMTNDSEEAALAQLGAVGIIDRFAFVAGYDSGFGAKPAPDPLLAFADRAGIAPARVAMVGDSTHDLIAGRAAGMQTVAVLTGTAGHDDLAPHADVVLRDIGHIPHWLRA